MSTDNKPNSRQTPPPKAAPSVDKYKQFREKLVPLMATVMGARTTGHPDLDRHLQALSDLIHNGVE